MIPEIPTAVLSLRSGLKIAVRRARDPCGSPERVTFKPDGVRSVYGDDRDMNAGRSDAGRTLPVVEIGTRESALCTIRNVGNALERLHEVRRHVRGEHKHRLDEVAVILRVIALEAQATYAISDREAKAFLEEHGPKED
jgi:hypothetical protein